MNTDKIIHKIRSLMKERFFYRKKDLINLINAIKFYPLVQINAALNQLVEDKNEYITDKYGRLGNMINIGDMYLFQPLELNNKNISIFDRSVPIDYKHDKLSFTLPEEKEEEQVSKKMETDIGQERRIASNAITLLNNMKSNYELASVKQTIIRGEDNWYKFCSLVISDMESDGISRDELLNILVAHLVDELTFENRLLIMNNLDKFEDNDFVRRIMEYINNDIIKNKGITGMLVNNNGKPQLLIKDKENIWKIAEAEDYQDLSSQLELIVNKFIPAKDKLNNLIGFMANFKQDYIIFKVKDLTKKRHKGARCDQSGRSDAIKMLNAIIGEDKFDGDSTLSQRQVCVIQEFTMRLYNKEMKNGLYWFLTPAQASLINIEKISV